MAVFKFEVDGKIQKFEADDLESAKDALEQHLSGSTKPSTDDTSSDLSAGLQLAAKQIPIIGSGIPETDRIKRFSKENPGYSNAIKIGVPVAANTALAVATGGMSIPEQLAVYGGVGVGDKLVQKGLNTTAGDLLQALGTSVASTGFGKALGAGLTKVVPKVADKLGTSALTASMVMRDPMSILAVLGAQGGSKILGTEAARKAVTPLAQGVGSALGQNISRNNEIPPEIATQLQALKGMIPYATQ